MGMTMMGGAADATAIQWALRGADVGDEEPVQAECALVMTTIDEDRFVLEGDFAVIEKRVLAALDQLRDEITLDTRPETPDECACMPRSPSGHHGHGCPLYAGD